MSIRKKATSIKKKATSGKKATTPVKKPATRKTCVDCGVRKKIECFYNRGDISKDGTIKKYNNCTECYVAEVTYRKNRKQDQLYDIQFENGCVECGEKDVRKLSEDHLDKETKKSAISKMLNNGASMDAIFEELAKCRTLCMNCHAVRTTIQENHYSHQYMLNKLRPPRKKAKTKF